MVRVATHLMFQGDAAEALCEYAAAFPDFVIEQVEKYGGAEIACFAKMKDGMSSGWGSGYAIIDEVLADLKAL